MANIVKKYSESYTNVNHLTYEFCFDVVECSNQVIEGLISNCGEEWNCNLPCENDSPYDLPIPEDGFIQIQLNLIDPAKMIPSDGWLNVSLCDENGDVVSTDINDFISRWVHGYAKPNNYQTYEIDASAIQALGLECFLLKFEADQLEVPICTQQFRIQRDCDDLICVESYKSNDCWGGYYGRSQTSFVGTEDFEYSNRIYIYGNTKCVSIEPSTLEDDADELTEYMRFFGRPIPRFVMRHLVYRVLSDASYVKVDGELWESGALGKYDVIEGSNMYRLSLIELERSCSTSSC